MERNARKAVVFLLVLLGMVVLASSAQARLIINGDVYQSNVTLTVDASNVQNAPWLVASDQRYNDTAFILAQIANVNGGSVSAVNSSLQSEILNRVNNESDIRNSISGVNGGLNNEISNRILIDLSEQAAILANANNIVSVNASTNGRIDSLNATTLKNSGAQTLNGDLNIFGNLNVVGSVVNLTVQQQLVNGSIFPSISGIFDLGTPSVLWNNVYASNLFGFLNASYILNAPWLDANDQRYNDTAYINQNFYTKTGTNATIGAYIAGLNITNGTNGVNGLNGTNGADGVNGTNGINGLNGTNGVNGVNGTNGQSTNVSVLNNGDGTYLWMFFYSNGTNFLNFTTANLTGPRGIQGLAGIAGVNGTNGATGIAGTNGTNGINGTSVNLTQVVNNGNGTYTWVFSNGLNYTTANLTGAQGVQGIQGVAGSNASVVSGDAFITVVSGVLTANVSSFQIFNDTVSIQAVNTTANIQGLGFVTWSNASGSFYDINNPLRFVNQTQTDALYYNKTYLDPFLLMGGSKIFWLMNDTVVDSLMNMSSVLPNGSLQSISKSLTSNGATFGVAMFVTPKAVQPQVFSAGMFDVYVQAEVSSGGTTTTLNADVWRCDGFNESTGACGNMTLVGSGMGTAPLTTAFQTYRLQVFNPSLFVMPVTSRYIVNMTAMKTGGGNTNAVLSVGDTSYSRFELPSPVGVTDISGKLDVTDQRYNETGLVTAVNASLQNEIANRVSNESDIRSKLTGGTLIGSGGLQGYLAQWVNGTVLNDSIIYQNGSALGIGTTNPRGSFEILLSTNTSGADINLYSTRYSNDVIAGGITGQKARGTLASPLAAQADDKLMSFAGRGYDGAGFVAGSNVSPVTIFMAAAENFTATTTGTYISFLTTPIGQNSSFRDERLRINGYGNLMVNNPLAIGQASLSVTSASLAGIGNISTGAYDGVNNITEVHLNGLGSLGALTDSAIITVNGTTYFVFNVANTTSFNVAGSASFSNTGWTYKLAPYIDANGGSSEEVGYTVSRNNQWQWAMFTPHTGDGTLRFSNSIAGDNMILTPNETAGTNVVAFSTIFGSPSGVPINPTSAIGLPYIPNHYVGIDGDTSLGRGFVIFQDSQPRWDISVYNNENSKFLYMGYNYLTDESAFTIANTGRIGVNKQDDILEYHTANNGTGLQEVFAGGLYTDDVYSQYQIRINTSSSFMWRSNRGGAGWGAYSANLSMPAGQATVALEKGVTVSFPNTTGYVVGDVYDFTAFSQHPPATFSINPTAYREVLYYQNSSGRMFDNTFEAGTSGGNSIVLLNKTGDYVYIGRGVPTAGFYVGLVTPGSGLMMKLEIWNGTAWQQVTSAQALVDNTNNFTQSGTISFDSLLVNWSTNITVDEYTPASLMYWMRLSTTTNATTVPTFTQLSPQPVNRFEVYQAPLDTAPVFSIAPNGDVVTSGTIKAKGFYANMYDVNGSNTMTFVSRNGNYNMTGWTAGLMNGFTIDTTNGNIQTTQAGLYMVQVNINGAVDNNDDVLWKVLVNGANDTQSLVKQRYANGQVQSSTMSFFRQLSVGDVLWVQGTDLTRNGAVFTANNKNILLTRIGNT